MLMSHTRKDRRHVATGILLIALLVNGTATVAGAHPNVASRTLPCGSLVSVRSNGRYVLVHILDRGPYGSSSRIIDLSPSAFRQLAPLGAGVIYVHVVRLRLN